MKRCVKFCHKGSWKKGVNALDSTKPVDLYVSNNYTKLLSKFPDEKLLDYKLLNVNLKFDIESTNEIIARSDPTSSTGIDGIDAELINYFAIVP